MLVRERVAEIREGPFGGQGSGYLIAPGLVLTALHVLLPPGAAPEKIPDGVKCKLRLTGDVIDVSNRAQASNPSYRLDRIHEIWREYAPDDLCVLDGDLVWPAPGAETDDHDVALVRIRDGQTSVTASAMEGRMSFGKVERPGAHCRCIGLPLFHKMQESQGGYIRELRVDAEAINLDDAGQPVSGRGVMRDLLVTTATPKKDDQWRGLSGAVFFHGDAIVGVAHADLNQANANRSISYYPLDLIPAGSDFWEMTGGAPAASQGEPFDFDAEFRILDRSNECRTFRRHLMDSAPSIATTPSKARLVLTPGHEVDELPHCAARLAEVAARYLGEAASVYGGGFPNLSLGEPQVSAEVRLENMLANWATALRAPRRKVEDAFLEDLKEIVTERLQEPDLPRLAVVTQNAGVWGESCDEALRGLWDFLDGLPASAPPCIVFLSVVTGKEYATDPYPEKRNWSEKTSAVDAAVEALRGDLAEESASRLFPLPSLTDLDQNDVRNWFEDVLEGDWRPRGEADDLLNALLPEGASEPMRLITQKIKEQVTMEKTA